MNFLNIEIIIFFQYFMFSSLSQMWRWFGGGGNVFLAFYAISNISRKKVLGINKIYNFLFFFGNIEKCPFTYWLNGRWFHQIVDIGNFNMKLHGRWFSQIVDGDSGNLYPIYIYKNVVLASVPVGGRPSYLVVSWSNTSPSLYVYLILAHPQPGWY